MTTLVSFLFSKSSKNKKNPVQCPFPYKIEYTMRNRPIRQNLTQETTVLGTKVPDIFPTKNEFPQQKQHFLGSFDTIHCTVKFQRIHGDMSGVIHLRSWALLISIEVHNSLTIGECQQPHVRLDFFPRRVATILTINPWDPLICRYYGFCMLKDIQKSHIQQFKHFFPPTFCLKRSVLNSGKSYFH